MTPTGLPPAIMERWLGATVRRGAMGREIGVVRELRYRRGRYYAAVEWDPWAPWEQVPISELRLVDGT